MVCHHCENWLGDLRRSDHSIAGRAVMTRRTYSSIIRQSLLFDFWLSPSWLYNLLGDDISKWNTFIFVPDMLQPCPSSERDGKQSHWNISDVKIPICIVLYQSCFCFCLLLATWHTSYDTTTANAPFFKKAAKKKELRRRSKSRSYTLLCFAKSLRQ